MVSGVGEQWAGSKLEQLQGFSLSQGWALTWFPCYLCGLSLPHTCAHTDTRFFEQKTQQKRASKACYKKEEKKIRVHHIRRAIYIY